MLLCKVDWMHLYSNHPDDPVKLRFVNCLTGETKTRTYRNHRAAKCAETKFRNRMTRIYCGHTN